MRITLILLASLGLTSCVTSGDLSDIALQIESVERVALDNTKTVEDVEVAAKKASEEIRAVADRVEERTEGAITMTEGLGGAGAITALGGVLLNLYRNGNRKKRGEAV